MGDRIQFTAPTNELKVANRELGTIESIGEDGRLLLKMDGGRTVELDPRKWPHLDHGYAMTSHSSEGQTADRVLIHETPRWALRICSIAAWHTSRSRVDAMTPRFIRTTQRRWAWNSAATYPILLRFSKSQERTR